MLSFKYRNKFFFRFFLTTCLFFFLSYKKMLCAPNGFGLNSSFHQIYSNMRNSPPMQSFESASEIEQEEVVEDEEIPLAQIPSKKGSLPPMPYKTPQTATSLPTLQCPPPYILEGNLCKAVKHVEGTYICPKQTGFFEKGECITVQEAAPSNVCPDGGLLEGKKCKITDVIPPTKFCMRGFSESLPVSTAATMAAAGNACLAQEIGKSQSVCPDGFTNKHGKCVKITSLPLTPGCPDGYVIQTYGNLKHAECVLAEVIQMETSCPKDYTFQDNICFKNLIQEPIGTCPDGLRFDEANNLCFKISVSDSEAVCPTGIMDDTRKGCVVSDSIPATLSCRKGFTLEENTCRKIVEHEVMYQCSVGYKMDESTNQCIGYDHVKTDHECPTGTFSKNKFCYQTLEAPLNPTCIKGELTPNGTCVYNEIVKPKSLCAGNLKKDGCIQETTTPANLVCESGVLEGKFCIMHISIPAESFCKDPEAQLTPDGCMQASIREMKFACPEGFKASKIGNECFMQSETRIELACPPGSELNGKKCEAFTRVSPILNCPKDFIMDSNGNCFMSDFAEPIIACYPGSKLSNGGACIPYTTNNQKHRKRLLRELQLNLQRKM